MERSYVMVKPEFANYKEVIEEVKRRLNNAGLRVEEEKYIKYDKKSAGEHYACHLGKPFYEKLLTYITSDKAYGMIVEGEDAISKIRALSGSTKDPAKGTIRYDIPEKLGLEKRVTENVIHSSDSQEAAQKEIAIFKALPKIEE